MRSRFRTRWPRASHPHIYFARGVWHVRVLAQAGTRCGAWVRWPRLKDAMVYAKAYSDMRSATIETVRYLSRFNFHDVGLHAQEVGLNLVKRLEG